MGIGIGYDSCHDKTNRNHGLELQVETLAHEMSKEKFNRFMSDVNRMIFDLVHSSDPSEKMGGIAIIGALCTLHLLSHNRMKRGFTVCIACREYIQYIMRIVYGMDSYSEPKPLRVVDGLLTSIC